MNLQAPSLPDEDKWERRNIIDLISDHFNQFIKYMHMKLEFVKINCKLETPDLPDKDKWEQKSLYDYQNAYYNYNNICNFDGNWDRRWAQHNHLELPELPDEDRWNEPIPGEYSYSTTTSSTSVIPYTTPSEPAGSGRMELWSPSWGLLKRNRLFSNNYSKYRERRPRKFENKYHRTYPRY